MIIAANPVPFLLIDCVTLPRQGNQMLKKYFYPVFIIVVPILLLELCSCKSSTNTASLFRLLPAGETGIDFENNLTYREDFNPYTYRNFFNGGGVAIGDINNDGLADVFFCSNQHSNKLYQNKGKFTF